jgi:magnesium transporter
MSHDARADFFASLPMAVREMLLPALAHAEREDIRRLASYPEDSAGAVMTSDYTTLEPHLTAEEAIVSLRQQALERETIYYSYVCDANRSLIGIVTLKKLVLSDPSKTVESLMHCELIFSQVDDDREDAAQKLRHYDLLALPVLDANNELVGIITYDDAMDVLQQEHVEDLEKFMAITGSHRVGEYLKTPVWGHFKNRISWIFLLAIMGLASGYVLHSFEDTLSSLMILALYMPMMADTGGNTVHPVIWTFCACK